MNIRPIKTHKLKILPCYFDDQIKSFKTFEIRKYDRDFKVNDYIELIEIDGKLVEEYKPTGRTALVRITSSLISTDESPFDGLEVGYCIMSTSLILSKLEYTDCREAN